MDAAISACKESIQLADALVLNQPTDSDNELDRATVMGNLYREDRRLDEAEKCLQDGKIVLERLLANEPADTNLQNSLAGLCCNFGLIYANQDRHADAVAAYDKAIALLTTLTRDHPGLPT